MTNGSDTHSFLSEPSATATPALNQTRVLSHHPPPQQFISPSSLVPQDSESLRSLATGPPSSLVAPGGSGSVGSSSPHNSALQSLQGSLSSLKSFNPDIVVGGSQRDIAVRMGSGFTNLKSLAAKPIAQQQPPPSAERQYGIDAHADPHGQIAITTKRGSQIQKDLSPRRNNTQQQQQQQPAVVLVPSSVPVQQRSSATRPLASATGRSAAPQWGSPPFTAGAQPKSITSPLAASLSPMAAPTSISPKRGGTVAWGVPPPSASSAPTTASTAAAAGGAGPKQTMPPPVSKAKPPQAKPLPLPANGGISLSHSSSAPSLVKPPNKSASFIGGQELVKNGLPQPFPSSSLKFGGSTNPLGELKRSEPVGDLTQIRQSAQKGTSPSATGAGSVGGGGGLVGFQPSSASVPNVAMTTTSFTPLSSFGFKVASPQSSGVTTATPAVSFSGVPPPSFTIGGLPSSVKPPSSVPGVLPPSSVSLPSTTTTASLFSKPFAPGITSLLSAPKPAPVVASTAAPGAPASVFPFGAPLGTQPQFTFSLGSGVAPPSFTAGPSSQGPRGFTASSGTTTQATGVSSTAATTTTSQLPGSGSGSIFSSMPQFSLGPKSSGSPFQFSASFPSSSPASSAAATATTSSSTPTPFGISGLGGGSLFKSPFTSQAASSSSSSPQSTAGAASVTTTTTTTMTKPSPLSGLGGSLSTPLLSTSSAAATTKPISFALSGSSSFVFGDKSGGVSLSSMLPKVAVVTDPFKLQEKGQREEKKEEGQEEDGEASTSSADSDVSGGEGKPSPQSSPSSELAKPKDGDAKKSPLAAAKLPTPPTTLPAAVQKFSTEGEVSKTISSIVKPAAAASATVKAPLSETASKDQDVLAGGAVKTVVPKDEEKVVKKPSPPPAVSQGSATTEAKPEVQQEQTTTAASKPSPEMDDVGGEKKDEHAQKLAETTPSPLITTTASTTATTAATAAAAALPVQAPQSTTATATTSDKDKPLPQAGDSKQAPPPTAATKEADSDVSAAPAKVQDSVPIPASKVEDDVGSSTLAGDEGTKEKQQPVVEEKPAETPSTIGGITRHVSFGGVEQLGGQQQLQLGQQQQQQPQTQQTQPQPASQGGLSLTASDLDIEGDMEGDGDMEGRLMLERDSWCCMQGGLIARS